MGRRKGRWQRGPGVPLVWREAAQEEGVRPSVCPGGCCGPAPIPLGAPGCEGLDPALSWLCFGVTLAGFGAPGLCRAPLAVEIAPPASSPTPRPGSAAAELRQRRMECDTGKMPRGSQVTPVPCWGPRQEAGAAARWAASLEAGGPAALIGVPTTPGREVWAAPLGWVQPGWGVLRLWPPGCAPPLPAMPCSGQLALAAGLSPRAPGRCLLPAGIIATGGC